MSKKIRVYDTQGKPVEYTTIDLTLAINVADNRLIIDGQEYKPFTYTLELDGPLSNFPNVDGELVIWLQPTPTGQTLFGLPVVIDLTMPTGEIKVGPDPFRRGVLLTMPETMNVVERFNMHKEDITITAPGLYNGQPTIRGTGLTVTDLLRYLAEGITTAELVERYPGLTRDDIRACQAWQQEQSE